MYRDNFSHYLEYLSNLKKISFSLQQISVMSKLFQAYYVGCVY